MENKSLPYLIWLDTNVENEENQSYINSNKAKIKEFDLLTCKKIEDVVEKLKQIKFVLLFS